VTDHHRHATPKHHVPHALDHDLPPGRLASKKCECCGDDGMHLPVADESESAHLLANEARSALHRNGLDDREIQTLADDFVAEDRGEDEEEFEDWALRMHERKLRVPA
jgi:hypothetical protein